MRIANILAITITCALATGCQNNIHIKVEKVMGVSSVSRNSRIGRQLSRSIDNLNAIISSCEAAQAARIEFINEFPVSADPPGSSPTRASVARQLGSYERALVSIVDKSMPLRRQCEAYFESMPEVHPPTDPRVILGRIRMFCEQKRRDLMAWPETLEKVPVVDKMAASGPSADLLKSPGDVIQDLKDAAEEAQPKFGGFASTDIYIINPSDPKYAEILKSGSPLGSVLLAPFWQNTSLETLTQAKVGVSGDSAIMLVMEHPGRVRVYQVSMDPTQITRNIGMLISKATAAGMKYLSGGL